LPRSPGSSPPWLRDETIVGVGVGVFGVGVFGVGVSGWAGGNFFFFARGFLGFWIFGVVGFWDLLIHFRFHFQFLVFSFC
jgi:hypothetical protein